MLENGQLRPFIRLKPLNDTPKLSFSILLNNPSNILNLLHAVVQPIQLSSQLISLLNKTSFDEVVQFIEAGGVGFGDGVDSMKLIVVGAEGGAK